MKSSLKKVLVIILVAAIVFSVLPCFALAESYTDFNLPYPNMNISYIDSSKILIEWDKVKDADGYIISRSCSGSNSDIYTNNEYIEIQGNSTFSYVDSDLLSIGSADLIYYYSVIAYIDDSDGDRRLSGTGGNGPIMLKSVPKATKKVSASSGAGCGEFESPAKDIGVVDVTWQPDSHVNGYTVYRATSKNGTYKAVHTTERYNDPGFFRDTGLTPGKTYYYKVRSFIYDPYCSSGYPPEKGVSYKKVYGPYSSVCSVKTVPLKVDNFKATSAASTKVKLRWHLENVSGYTIYRATSKNGTYKAIARVDSWTNDYIDTGLKTDKTYYYKIRAYVDYKGERIYGSYSDIDPAKPTIKPAKVESTNARAISASSVKVSWSKVDAAAGYTIYRSTSKNGTYKAIKRTTGTNRTYTDKGLKTNKAYYYKVRAYKNINGERVYGAFSPVDVAKPSAQPGKVELFNAYSGGKTSVKLSWSNVAGADGFTIYRSGSKSGTFKAIKRIADGDTYFYKDTGLKTGKVYYYKMRAYREYNGKRYYGAYSAVDPAKPKA